MCIFTQMKVRKYIFSSVRIREWYYKSLDSIPRMIPLEDASNLYANVYINLRIVD